MVFELDGQLGLKGPAVGQVERCSVQPHATRVARHASESSRAVAGVTYDGVTNALQMAANLVFSTGLGEDLEKAETAELFKAPIVGDRLHCDCELYLRF